MSVFDMMPLAQIYKKLDGPSSPCKQYLIILNQHNIFINSDFVSPVMNRIVLINSVRVK